MGLSQELQAGLSPGMRVDPEKRSSMINFILPNEENLWLFNRVWETVEQFETPEIQMPKFLQFTEYKEEYGGKFGAHRDTENFYHATNVTDLERKVTLVIQLSDPLTYEGGELVLIPDEGEEIVGLKYRGCGILFPSNMTHEAKRVTLGSRYSLVAWFEGLKV
jgi:PKHD-type hydroxylase